MFYDDLVVFRWLDGQYLEILANVKTQPVGSNRSPESVLSLYSLVREGSVLNEYRRTFAGYLLYKGSQAFSRRSLDSLRGTSTSSATEVAVLEVGPKALVIDPVRETQTLIQGVSHGQAELPGASRDMRQIYHLYLRARLEHMFGEPAKAAVLYRQVSDAPTATRPAIQTGAHLFASQLGAYESSKAAID